MWDAVQCMKVASDMQEVKFIETGTERKSLCHPAYLSYWLSNRKQVTKLL
jgi:hypothetical protein